MWADARDDLRARAAGAGHGHLVQEPLAVEPFRAGAVREPVVEPAQRRAPSGSPAWRRGPWEADGFAPASSSRSASRDSPGLGAGAWSARGEPLSARRRYPQEVDHSVAELDQRLTQLEQAESSRFRMMTDQVQKLTESLQSMRLQRELQEERRGQELRYLEKNAQQDMAKAREERKAMHLRFEERADKFFQDRREELRRAGKPRSASRLEDDREEADACTLLTQKVSHEIYRVGGILEEQRTAREEYGERIQVSLQAEFQKVEAAIYAEKSLRDEAQHTVQRMVQDVCMRIRAEIQQERDTRESVQSRLLGLLEETCSRIEASFGGVVPSEPLGFPLAVAGNGQGEFR